MSNSSAAAMNRAMSRVMAAKVAMMAFSLEMAKFGQKANVYAIHANKEITLPAGLLIREKPYWQQNHGNKRKNRIYR